MMVNGNKMRLTERDCGQCDSNFDLIKDKYFVKKPSKFITVINLILRCIVVTVDLKIGEVSHDKYKFYSYYLHNIPYFSIKEGTSVNYNGKMVYYLVKNNKK